MPASVECRTDGRCRVTGTADGCLTVRTPCYLRQAAGLAGGLADRQEAATKDVRLKPAEFNAMMVVARIECNARSKVNECAGSSSSSCFHGAMLA